MKSVRSRPPTRRHYSRTIDGVELFWREAGDPAAPAIVLLAGHPSGSHAYNELIERLAPAWRVVAPDYPGYGFSAAPPDAPWTFDWLATVTDHLLESIGLERYVTYMFDFGAPVGFRIAQAHPERVAGIVSQNGNIYTDGFGPGVAALAQWWTDRAGGQAAVDEFLRVAGTKLQWEAGMRDPASVDPAMWTLDQALLNRPERRRAAEALLWDYQHNPARFPAWQAYLREHQPPLLALWGANDPFFIPAGAEAYKRDVPSAEVTLLDTGHFALVEEVEAIAERVNAFLAKIYR